MYRACLARRERASTSHESSRALQKKPAVEGPGVVLAPLLVTNEQGLDGGIAHGAVRRGAQESRHCDPDDAHTPQIPSDGPLPRTGHRSLAQFGHLFLLALAVLALSATFVTQPLFESATFLQ